MAYGVLTASEAQSHWQEVMDVAQATKLGLDLYSDRDND